MLQREYNRLKLLENRINKLEKTIQYVKELEMEPGLILGELREIKKMIDNIQRLEDLVKNPTNIREINRLQDLVNTYDDIDDLKLSYINLTKSYKDNVAFTKKYFENNPLDSQDYMEMRNSLLYGEYEMLAESLEGVKLIKTPEGQVIVDNREYLRLRALSDNTKRLLEEEAKEPERKRQNTTISNFKVF